MEHILSKFEAYLLTEKCVSRNTFQAYMQDLLQFTKFLEKNKKLLSDSDVTTLKLFLQELKKNNTTARTLCRKISSLKIFYAWAHYNLQWPNHAQSLILPKIEQKLPQYLNEQEVHELIEAAHNDTSHHGHRNRIMLCILYGAGLRISELTNLKTSHIDFDHGCLTIEGKGGKSRVVPVPASMMVLVKEYLETTHKQYTQQQKTDYLFPIIYGKKMRAISRQAFWAILKELCKKTSIKRSISPHVLRHSLATHLLKNGAHLRSLQLLLGHENLSTVQIYTHVELSHVRTIYDKKHPRSS